MNRYLQKCPQCGSLECGPWRCRFTMIRHKDAAPQVSPKTQVEGSGATYPPSAVAAPDVGYECAWPK